MHKWLKYSLYLTAALVAAVAFWKIQVFQDPTGGDGYFYLKQIKTLFLSGDFYHQDHSLFFLLAWPLRYFASSDLQAYQFLTAISFGFLVAGLTKNYLGLQWRFIWALGFIALQLSVLRMSFEFCKQGLAMGFFVWGTQYWFYNQKRKLVGFWLLAAFTHKIFLLYAIPFILWIYLKPYLLKIRAKQNEISFSWKAVIKKAVLISVAFKILLAVLLFETQVGRSLRRQAWHAIQQFQFENPLHVFVGSVIITTSQIVGILIFLILSFSLYRKIRDSLVRYLIILTAIPLLPLFGGTQTEIKYRLLLISHALTILLWPYLALAFQEISWIRRWVPRLTLATLLPLAITTYIDKAELNLFPWVNTYSQWITNLVELEKRVDGELVTHHGLQFYIDYKTSIRARSLRQEGMDPRYQVAYVPDFFRLNPEQSDEIDKIQLLKLGDHYALFEYTDFQWLQKKFPLLKHPLNQIRIRPDYVPIYK